MILFGKYETCEFLQSTVCYIFNQVYNSRYVKSWVWGKQVFYAESRNAASHFRFPLLREILFGRNSRSYHSQFHGLFIDGGEVPQTLLTTRRFSIH